MKWNKFPDVLPPDDKLVLIIFRKKEDSYSIYNRNEDKEGNSSLLVDVSSWNLQDGWRNSNSCVYIDAKILYWIEIPDYPEDILKDLEKLKTDES